MFKELTFYLEACESGSMFPNLDASENIYAITASNATQSSWGAYCGSEAYVNGTNIGSCLGDLFSINWMEDTEANDVSIETLEQQYETVKTKTNKSPVMKFGNFTFMSDPIGEFEGTTEGNMGVKASIMHHANHIYKQAVAEKTVSRDVVDSRDHDLHVLYNRVMTTGSSEDMEALQKELNHREFVDSLFNSFEIDAVNAPEQPQDYDCLRFMVGSVENMCGDWSAYSLKYVRKLANACDTMSAD